MNGRSRIAAPIFYGKEVRPVNAIFNFLLSVAAGVAADAICKWLDEQFRSGKHYPLGKQEATRY